MNPRRRTLLVLAPLLVIMLFLGDVGDVEVALWLALVVAWVWAFVFWAREPRHQRSER